MSSKIQKSLLSPAFYKLIIIILVAVVLYQSYVLIQLGSQSNNSLNPIKVQPITENPPTQSLKSTSGNTLVFTHPELGYKVTFPSGWKPQIFKSLAGAAIQPYKDFIVYSPDYESDTTSENPSHVIKGASIFIRVSETPYKTIEEKYKDNVIVQSIGRNVTRTNLKGIPAIRYDYHINGENATNLTLIDGEFWYLIKYQYANEETKNKYQAIINEVINSFDLNN